MAPPPGEITRRTGGSGSAGPERRDRLALHAPERRLAVLAKISGILRPAASSIQSSRSTNAAPWRRASRRPIAVFPYPGSPTSTTSIAASVVPAEPASPSSTSAATAAVAADRPPARRAGAAGGRAIRSR